MNERFSLDGGYIGEWLSVLHLEMRSLLCCFSSSYMCSRAGILEWILGKRDGMWMSFLTRSVLEKANRYSDSERIPLFGPQRGNPLLILKGTLWRFWPLLLQCYIFVTSNRPLVLVSWVLAVWYNHSAQSKQYCIIYSTSDESNDYNLSGTG